MSPPQSRARRRAWLTPGPPARRRVLLAGLASLVAVALGTGACGKSSPMSLLGPDLRPTVTIVSSTVDTSLTHPASWSATVLWSVTDADGFILRSEYAVDPGASETTWVQAQTPRASFNFVVKHREPNGSISPEYHVFVVRAFDDRNLPSPIVSRAFYASTVAPSVQIAQPTPNTLLLATVPRSFTVAWVGDDPDGFPTHRPDHYRVRTILAGDPLYELGRMTPDSLVRLGEASGWLGWTREGGDTTSCTLSGLALGGDGLFAVIAFDNQGAHTPQLALDKNLLQFHVSDVAPSIHMFSPYFDFTFLGGLQTDPAQLWPVQLPAGVPFQFYWEGKSAPGSYVRYTRWVLDPFDLADSTERTDPADVHHWSGRGPDLNFATVGPLFDQIEHNFWIEVVDNLERKSLSGFRFVTVRPDLQRELLIVDDTRLEPDKFVRPTNCPAVYTKPWPSAAELDTFLYARGGMPWRCAQADPTATSVPGLFAGYRFDTLGTRLGLEDPATAAPLYKLAQYRHVLWLVDQQSASLSAFTPPTALRAMSSPGHADVLYAYGRLGGQIWLAGGGAAYATLVSFDSPANNLPQGPVFDHQRDELRIGQLLYDQGHLRSAIAVSHAGGLRYLRSPAARGGWSGQGEQRTLSAPDYSLMPVELRVRTQETDPIPPTRLASQAGLFYPGSTDAEYLSAPNPIVEDFDPDSSVVHLESTLDTLYDVSGGTLVISPAPAMTYYHGLENPQFLFSGFDLWSWTRSDAQALVDFVLGEIWRMTRTTSRAADSRSSGGAGDARRPAVRGAAPHRLDPPGSRP